MRNEAKFDSFYSEVTRDSANITAEPTLSRQKKDPEDLMMVQGLMHMKLPKTGIAICTLK